MTTRRLTRRRLLATGGGSALAAFAGCLGDDDDAPEPTDDDDDNGDLTLEEWLANVENFDGIADYTGQNDVEVLTGQVEDAAQRFVFEPAAIRIDAGTTVRWEWVDDANHSVTHEDGDDFDSGVDDEGPFEHTFDAAGTFLYFCDPHRNLEQKGAIVVE